MKRLNDPQPVRDVLRQQWSPAAVVLGILTGLAMWLIHDHVDRMVYAVPLGILLGGTIWALAVVLAARGWIAFIFDD